jgi:hypothetical protein
VRYYGGGDWFGFEWNEDWPIYGDNQDTLMLNTVRIKIVKSNDSLYHVHKVNISQGRNVASARNLAEKISFNVSQRDSTLLLPKGFAISRNEKFRNQRILLVIEVPVGKKIEIDRSIDYYDWFTVDYNRRRGWNIDWDDHWNNSYGWDSNVEYVMTNGGLERTNKPVETGSDSLRDGTFKGTIDANGVKIKVEGEVKTDEQYRYERRVEETQQNKRDSGTNQEEISGSGDDGTETNTRFEMLSPIYILNRFIR